MEPGKRVSADEVFSANVDAVPPGWPAVSIFKKILSPSGRLTSNLASEARKERIKISLLFALHRLKQDRPDWPNLGFDFRPVIEKYISILQQKFPTIHFWSPGERTRRS